MNTLTEDQNILKVVKEYFNPAKVLNIKRFGSGHINDTYIVEFKEIKYILQKINTFLQNNTYFLKIFNSQIHNTDILIILYKWGLKNLL